MNLELSGKTALVTGGSQGIGRAIAFGLGAEGARVAICARDKSRLEQTAQEIKAKSSAEVLVVPGDLSRLDEVNRVAATVKERFGRIDILVNNAGAIRGGDFLTIPDEQWAGDWSLKILGYVRMARAVFPMMHGRGTHRQRRWRRGAQSDARLSDGRHRELGAHKLLERSRRPGRPVKYSGHRRVAGRNRDRALGESHRPASRIRRQERGGSTRRGGEPLPAQADRDAGGHRRPRVLPGIGTRLVHHGCVHHGRRRRHPWSLPVILSVPINLTCVTRCHISLRQHGVARL